MGSKPDLNLAFAWMVGMCKVVGCSVRWNTFLFIVASTNRELKKMMLRGPSCVGCVHDDAI